MVAEKNRGGIYGIQKAKSSQDGDRRVLGLRTLGFGFLLAPLPPSSVSLVQSLNFSLPQYPHL